MKKETKIRLAWWIGFPSIMIILRFGDGGRIWNYMGDHLWLTCALPLAAMFLVLLARIMYVYYRRQPRQVSKMSGARSAKARSIGG